ncbi:MAG TPA: HDIG domain-containing protein [Anaerolineae bacterium]|nr:HDIG domain-containing protein [Anaerolineae bacterium]HQK12658.1 HDIG domain-containing protein [Anaerolineae bacterium]
MDITYSRKISRGWGFRQSLFWLWLTLLTAFVLVFSFPNDYNLVVGAVAPRDIRAPMDFTYVSEIRTQQARKEAVRQVAPVYTSPDFNLARQQYDRARQVLAYLRELRADIYASEAQGYAWVLAVPELADLSLSTVNLILDMPEASWNRVQVETLRLLDQIMRQQRIREEDLTSVRMNVSNLVALELGQDEALVVDELVQRFLKPNVFYDEAATEAARQAARNAVGPAFHTLRSGEIIVREGNVVSELDMEALHELGLLTQTWDWGGFAFMLLLAGIAVFALGFYLWRFQIDVLSNVSTEFLFVLLLSLFLILARVLIKSGDILPYLFPAAALAMLLTTTVGLPSAVGALIFMGGVAGWIAGRSLGFAVFVTLSGVVGALTLPRYEQTGTIFRSGLLSGLLGAATLFAFSASDFRTEPLPLLLRAGGCVAGGIISGGLTIGGLFLLAPLFDLTTTFRLTELSRPNHPLLQQMLREAPATFNHVMMVASLAEQAAERIGANTLLTRVGAYYHDIGKLARPYFFVENQQGLSNPHDRLDPYTSVDVLKGHIRDGIKLARQYHLPARVRAFIPEHHGTTRASFFYRKAVEAAGGEADLVDESQFRYPGPIPKSRETLLVMLADGSEAATRARRPATPEELANVVSAIFEQRMIDGQLDDCPITMKELHIVKATYIELLRGAFHPRIQYPELKEPTLGEQRLSS